MAAKIAMVSLGCSKNLVDSEIMAGLLDKKSYKIIENCEDADYIIVNTCGFIESAKEESIDAILEMAEFKKTGNLKGLIATGCLSERYHDDLMESIPELDGIIGTGNFARIAETIQEIEETGNKVMHFGNIDVEFDEDLPRNISTPAHTAYVKISEGCDNHCTYCIIPKLRGKYRSRKPENILNEVRTLADNGTKEIILIAQDTTMYGYDLYGKRILHKLLEDIDLIEGLEWVRLMYAYPENIDHKLIQTIKNSKKILHYLDIPIQHTEDKILKRMGRRTDKRKIFDLFSTLRKEIPDMIIRSTMIAGFPGESDEDHQEMLRSIEELQIDKLGVFEYSREEDTPAANMDGQIDDETKKYRQFSAMEVQRPISERRLSLQIGKTIDAIVEEYTEEGFSGRTWMDAPEIDGLIYVSSDIKPPIGSIVRIVITDSTDFDLIGVLNDEFTK
ncbi:30S ribosomal protein S12 methylthiotransferase RimO [Alkalibacter mobilis]|uniref:30S ribosomal protein S12 methylthiotransferase RimO n=1 Tax=Alkalibacter mobilis TaxID=2787712 RepID=UPI00189CC378|nr:30S ribosomal protein S12 methylthiotransferase RimO [Alkalibacter mobilis]MBF7095714.1 30S ribosomal protein S12 methylthiotransferase RimO [Alkalibacter mobilis]